MTTDPHIHAKPSAVDDSWSILMQFSSPDGAEWSFFLFTQVQFWIISMYHLTSQNRAIVPGKWPVDVRDMSMAFLLYDGGQRLTAGQLKKWHCYCTVILTHCCIKLNFSSGCCLLGVVHCTHVCVCVCRLLSLVDWLLCIVPMFVCDSVCMCVSLCVCV